MPGRHGSAEYSPPPETPTSISYATWSSTGPCGAWRTRQSTGGEDLRQKRRQEQHWANLNGRINHTFTTVKATKTQRMQAYQPIQDRPHVEQTTLETGHERMTTWQTPFQDLKPSQNGLSQ